MSNQHQQQCNQPQKQQRTEWFSDPHLLSQRIHNLMKSKDSTDYAEQLVIRHTGSSNEGVYGALIGGFARLGDREKALHYFKEVFTLTTHSK